MVVFEAGSWKAYPCAIRPLLFTGIFPKTQPTNFHPSFKSFTCVKTSSKDVRIKLALLFSLCLRLNLIVISNLSSSGCQDHLLNLLIITTGLSGSSSKLEIVGTFLTLLNCDSFCS